MTLRGVVEKLRIKLSTGRRGRRFRDAVGGLWDAWRWVILGALALTALGLGYVSFWRFGRGLDPPWSFLDVVYRTLQLFTLESGLGPAPIPWELDLARFLAPAVAVAAAAVALIGVFDEQWGQFRLKYRKGHVVVCGLGRKGILYTKAFVDKRGKVGAVETDGLAPKVVEARHSAVTVVVGSASDLKSLDRAGAKKAKMVIAVTGDDAVNMHVAKLVGDQTKCYVHITNESLIAEVKNRPGVRTPNVEYFNVFEQGARVLVTERPPFQAYMDSEGEPRIAVFGLGLMGCNVVVEAARVWRALRRPGSGPLRVTAIDRVAGERVALLKAQHPDLEAVWKIDHLDMDVRSAEFVKKDSHFAQSIAPLLDYVYVCFDDEVLGVAAAMVVRRARRDVPVVVQVVDVAGWEALLTEDAMEPVLAFCMFEHTCTAEVLQNPEAEIIALATHNSYSVHGFASAGPWEELDEEKKAQNRQAAAAVRDHLTGRGFELVRFSGSIQFSDVLSEDDIDALAQMEHLRWYTSKYKAGWRYSEIRNDGRKLHDAMRQWSELEHRFQEQNRDMIRDLPRIVAQAGCAIVKAEGGIGS